MSTNATIAIKLLQFSLWEMFNKEKLGTGEKDSSAGTDTYLQT